MRAIQPGNTMISELQAVDVHGHYGTYVNSARHQSTNLLMSGDAQTVIERASKANTALTIVSPLLALFPQFKTNTVAGNEDAFDVVAKTPGLLQWVVINPLDARTYEQAERMLKSAKCVGIKIHPELHGYPIVAHGEAIFAFAAQHDAVVLTHSGEQNSMPDDFVTFADAFPSVKLILAHIGCGWDGNPTHQIRAIQRSRHGNVFADTSSAQSMVPGLIELAVREAGARHVLYGTDTPLYFAPMQRARIDHADISDDDKRLILRDNAVELLKLNPLQIAGQQAEQTCLSR